MCVSAVGLWICVPLCALPCLGLCVCVCVSLRVCSCNTEGLQLEALCVCPSTLSPPLFPPSFLTPSICTSCLCSLHFSFFPYLFPPSFSFCHSPLATFSLNFTLIFSFNPSAKYLLLSSFFFAPSVQSYIIIPLNSHHPFLPSSFLFYTCPTPRHPLMGFACRWMTPTPATSSTCSILWQK